MSQQPPYGQQPNQPIPPYQQPARVAQTQSSPPQKRKYFKIGGLVSLLAALAALVTILQFMGVTNIGTLLKHRQSPDQLTATATSENGSSYIPTAQVTQDVHSPYPDVQGLYSGHEQCPELANLPPLFQLDIAHVFTTTQQNQQSFQGTFTDASATCGNSLYNTAGTYDINNGTFDQNGKIGFTITRRDQNGYWETITYTGTAQSGRGWQGTFSASNGAQGQWDAE